MVTAIAIGGLMLAAAIGTVLIAPVRIALAWDDDAPAPRVRVRWLFVEWSGKPSRSASPRPPKPPPPRRSTARRTGRRLRAVLWTRGLIPRLATLLAGVLRLLVPRTLDLRLRIGFDDPASTGLLYAAAQAAAALPPSPAWRLDVVPDFAGPVFAGRGRVEWVLRPGRVLWLVGVFLASPPVWRAAWAAIRPEPSPAA